MYCAVIAVTGLLHHYTLYSALLNLVIHYLSYFPPDQENYYDCSACCIRLRARAKPSGEIRRSRVVVVSWNEAKKVNIAATPIFSGAEGLAPIIYFHINQFCRGDIDRIITKLHIDKIPILLNIFPNFY